MKAAIEKLRNGPRLGDPGTMDEAELELLVWEYLKRAELGGGSPLIPRTFQPGVRHTLKHWEIFVSWDGHPYFIKRQPDTPSR